ncbi:MAG TPA: FAD-dependent oxidoreductase, partial [Candidatus Synoicihabitans sp.]|nr:FAD-dependent oxidoreductase [Candidatus Synoicihabitans sp.]
AERNVFVFQPMLPEVVGASLSPADVVNPLRQFCRGVTVLQGNIQSIDVARRELTIDGGRFTRNHTVVFEHLVLALGNITDLSRVPGMSEYGWPMKTVADALRLRAALINRLEEANLVHDEAIRTRLLTFVVVGGGYTGVETAGQLHALVTESKHLYVNLRDAPVRVVLVHSQNQLLLEIGPELGAYAGDVLRQNGIEVRLNTRVVEVTATKAILSDGTHIEAATLVSSVGSAPHPLVLDVCAQIGVEPMRGRIPVEPTMRLPGQSQLWSIGDCAAVPWNDRGTAKVAPPTSQFALREGRQLGANLVRMLRGEGEARLRPFTYRYLGQLATIGERQAVAEVFGIRFRGFIAWWLWRTIYLSKLPGLVRKLRVMIDWTFELLFSRDISLLLPPPEDVLRAIHLEDQEVLFEAGAPARAFFFIKRGEVQLTEPTGEVQTLATGSVIDQSLVDADGCWRQHAVASGSTDLIAFRGRALELLRGRLRLVPRPPQ